MRGKGKPLCPLTYRDAGVDVEAGRNLVRAIAPLMESTRREGVLGEVGGFGGFFQVPEKFREPVLVAGADGVGTKLALAQMAGGHKSVGVDLVAMCANDVLCHGAEPLFFLDYFAAGRLEPEVAQGVLEGVAAGCREAGCALLGGETAEMPGFYGRGVYELAGFCVGAVERASLIDGSAVREGDSLLGLPSSGLHSNGFSLVRKVLLEKEDLSLDEVSGPFKRSLKEELLEPTRIYVKPILSLLERVSIHGIAHITGGGIPENLGRVLPQGLRARLEPGSWPVHPIFSFLADRGGIEESEMYGTFNMGLGMILILGEEDFREAASILGAHGLEAFRVGRVERGKAPRVSIGGGLGL